MADENSGINSSDAELKGSFGHAVLARGTEKHTVGCNGFKTIFA